MERILIILILSLPSALNGLGVYQTMVQCKLLDKDKPGQMITKDAASGSTTDELCYYNNSFTYNIVFNITSEVLKPHLEDFKKKFKTFYYPTCIETLMNYLKKRVDNVNRKMKPRLRLITKANTDSGGSQVSCLATGFYPRHINLTLFKDGQPVSDRKITGGDLLPNGDGTYQMRKTLEISAEEQREKHRYTCSATHSSLDNKLDVYLDNGHYRFWMVGCVVSVLVLVCIILAIRWRLQRC
ncbi:MHC class I polypeptide-related sequence A-like isoform X2 [Xyrauchen texanus]|uniref:MHC class I polypeptide-related sequence A-like isoform X2 n=1 Tax=Xyrauchen texanus TaxID=154827 RepID=UPI002242C417|nr:MHC class I polypeptide-related sequence A-like isoform X2 [Xyrauchen texanus]